jgi:hypothetical protein
MAAKPFLVCMLVAADAISSCSFAKDVVYGNGNNVGKAQKVQDADACCNLCNGNSKCGTWAFGTTDGKCYLHGLNDFTPTQKPDRISGNRSTTPAAPTPAPAPIAPVMACTGNYSHFPFCNASMSLDERINDLLSRIPDERKPDVLTARNPTPFESIGVPTYYWGTNCIQSVENGAHGESPKNLRCVDGKCASHFPSPPGWMASFDAELMKEMAIVFGRELRAFYNLGAAKGLDCWGPVINLNRDPRWGRNGEAGAEDPHLMGLYATAFTDGFQRGRPEERSATNPSYTVHGQQGVQDGGGGGKLLGASAPAQFFQGVATLKHFDANSLEGDGKSGPNRHNFDVQVDNYTLADAYFPAFKVGIQQAGAR